MPESFDARRASLELTSYIRDVFSPPDGDAPMKSVLGAYILKSMLKSAGYAIVPLKPTELMERAFNTSSFRSFENRYAALVNAAWPEDDTWGIVVLDGSFYNLCRTHEALRMTPAMALGCWPGLSPSGWI